MANTYLRSDSVRANPTNQPVSLASIRRVCRTHSVAETRFGREAVNDPRLVYDLMNGRELRPATLVKVAAYIASLEAADMAKQPTSSDMPTQDLKHTDATVQAYLHARAVEDEHVNDGNDSVEGQLASFALKGAQEYTLAWSVETPDRGALVALLGFERLGALIDGHELGGGKGRPSYIELDAEVRYELSLIKGAFVHLWRYFDSNGCPHLRDLAADMGAAERRS